jgi:hypothetical protein
LASLACIRSSPTGAETGMNGIDPGRWSAVVLTWMRSNRWPARSSESLDQAPTEHRNCKTLLRIAVVDF